MPKWLLIINNTKELKNLFDEYGIEIFYSRIDNMSALHYAASHSYYDSIQFLIDNGFDVNYNVNCAIPLSYAYTKKCINLLLDAGADTSIIDVYGCTPLHYACRESAINFDNIELLLKIGVDINVLDNNNQTVFYNCHNYLFIKYIITITINLGIKITPEVLNTPDLSGYVVIHRAIYYNDVNFVKQLVEIGADINQKTDRGWTPLYSAIHYNYLEIIQLLVANSADINITNNDGWTPLHHASSNAHLEIAQLLITANADLNIQTNTGWTALSLAYLYDHLEIAQLLIKHGAQIDNDIIIKFGNYLEQEAVDYINKNRQWELITYLNTEYQQKFPKPIVKASLLGIYD